MEPIRARPGLVDDPAILVDHVEPLWPSCIGSLCFVIKAIHNGGEFDPQFRHTELSHLAAFFVVLRLREQHVVFQVIWILPDVTRMRFADINNVKSNLIFVLLPQLVQGGNLPPEWRSSVAAEHEYDRFPSSQGRQLKVILAIRAFQ